MQIKTMPSRYPIIGRIRLGEKTTTKSGREAPKKGETLRFTCDDEVTLKAIASQLGGEIEPWEKGEQAFQLTSESAFVNVFLPVDPIDTSYERWGSGGCQRRCDGERCVYPQMSGDGGHLAEDDCLCINEGLTPGDRNDIKDGACQVTVRLRLVLPDVPGIGAWLCTSHSKYAAMELPGQVNLLDAMRERGQLVPAEFGIEQRSEKKAWEKYKRDYIVPVLRVRASLRQLGTAPGMTHNEIEAKAAPALPAPKGATTRDAIDNSEISTSSGLDEPDVVTSDLGPGDGEEAKPPPRLVASSPGQRVIVTMAEKQELDAEELDAVIDYATDVTRLADLSDVADKNKVLAALRDLKAGKITLAYTGGKPSVAEAGDAA